MAIDLEKELIIVDNSPDDILRLLCGDFDGVSYFFTGKNLGFGAGHNNGFSARSMDSDVHLIINPDIRFDADDMKACIQWLAMNDDIALATPRILNPDGTLQYAVREIPTPLTLMKRRLNIFSIFDGFIRQDEWRNVSLDEVTDIPFAHGAFLMFKSEVFEKLGGFDEHFFMYMEDADIFIRAKMYGRTVMQPAFSVVHEHRRASSRNFRLFRYHLVSAFRFFRKYPRYLLGYNA